MSETRETAIERHLDGLTSEPEWDTMHEGERDAILRARDLVRCWREYLRAIDDARTADNMWTSEAAAGVAREREDEARVLLARGDEK